jgi:membrane protease YdiL (CAAX protease family)
MSDLNFLDFVLLAALLVVLPAQSLWRTWFSRRTALAAVVRYRRSLLIVFSLLGLLAANWWIVGRSASALGLAAPVSTFELGLIGLTFVALLGAGAMSLHATPKPGSMEAEAQEKLPKTMEELRLFVAMAVVLGFGWEVLYRAYLLFALTPVAGTAGAISLAALSYGIGHGDKSVLQFAGSLFMAFAFTAAFAVSGSLWWLIVLHAGLPLIAAAYSWKAISLSDG